MNWLKEIRDHRKALDAIHSMTPEQHAQMDALVQSAHATGDSHPLIDFLTQFLSSIITDPTKLDGLVAAILKIIGLFRK